MILGLCYFGTVTDDGRPTTEPRGRGDSHWLVQGPSGASMPAPHLFCFFACQSASRVSSGAVYSLFSSRLQEIARSCSKLMPKVPSHGVCFRPRAPREPLQALLCTTCPRSSSACAVTVRRTRRRTSGRIASQVLRQMPQRFVYSYSPSRAILCLVRGPTRPPVLLPQHRPWLRARTANRPLDKSVVGN